MFFARSFLMQKVRLRSWRVPVGCDPKLVTLPRPAPEWAPFPGVLSRLTLTYCALTAAPGVASAFALAKFPLGEADQPTPSG